MYDFDIDSFEETRVKYKPKSGIIIYNEKFDKKSVNIKFKSSPFC